MSVHLTKDGGQQHAPEFRAVNPQERVPALELDGRRRLLQSLAIIEYLDEVYPHPPLLPEDRDRARQCARGRPDHRLRHPPAQQHGPLNYLRHVLKADKAAVEAWYAHWVSAGFAAVEALIKPGPYCFGSQVTVADICLVPQVYNARRFKVPLDDFPHIVAVDAALMKLSAFDAARPENQPDAE